MTSRATWFPVLSVLILGALAGCGSSIGGYSMEGRENWPAVGTDKGSTRYSPLAQIDRSNVNRLEILWRRPAVDASLTARNPDLGIGRYFNSQPLLVNGVLYAPNGVGLVEAFDPGTGRTIWVQQPFSPEELPGRTSRGIDYWSDGDDRRLLSIRGEHLYALDLRTGEPVRSFGQNGRVNLRLAGARMFNSGEGPIVVGDVVVVGGTADGAGDGGTDWKGSVPEDVRGFDVRTGRLLWTFHVVPRDGEFGADTWDAEVRQQSGDLGSWCCMTADLDLGYVYVPLTAPTSAYYGGHRPGDNLFSNSLVALDARTGERKWHFQMVRHDVWEYDNVGPPVLGDITVDGRTIPAVMQANKSGYLFTLDRRTGEPVWPIEERPVPQSSVPSERTAPTQPVPSRPAPLDRQGASMDDLIDFTPELRRKAAELARRFVLGQVFTPPSAVDDGPDGKLGTYTIPGPWGSANWNTGAFDPETQMYYGTTGTWTAVIGLAPAGPEAQMRYEWVSGTTSTLDGLPIVKPPWGRVTAIDMSRGEHVWMAANSDGPQDHPLLAGLDVGPLGVVNRPVPLVTRTLLFLGEGSDAIMGTAPIMWGRNFRAYDKMTGEVVAQLELPAGTTGAPMTYLHRGRQYIVVPVASREHPAEWVALGLP